MSSSSTGRNALRGRQEPRVRLEPERAYSDGEDAAVLASAYGLTPDPWQRMILDAWLGRDDRDRYTATRCGVLVPRQNGKNALIEIRELYGAAIQGEKILHTAHEVKTARKAFLRVASFFENERQYPELAALVVAIRKTNGQEAITLKNGGSIEFSARSKGAARGFTVDVVICDESSFLTDEQLESLMPTMAAAPLGNPQLIVVGTPPNHNQDAPVFGRMRKDGQKGEDPKLSWHEWSIPDMAVDLSNPQTWADCNPALGIRLKFEQVEDEYKTMSPEGFAQERLCFWLDVAAAAKAIDADKWAECATDAPPGEEDTTKIAYGVKFSADGALASLAVAAKSEDSVHVELIEHRSMREGVGWLSSWLVPRLKKTASTVVVDGLHWQGRLVEQLKADGLKAKGAVTVPKADDVVTAASGLVDAVANVAITHFDQPALNESALGADKRTIGTKGGWGFGGEDSTPVEAAALALWGVKTSRRNPRRKQAML